MGLLILVFFCSINKRDVSCHLNASDTRSLIMNTLLNKAIV